MSHFPTGAWVLFRVAIIPASPGVMPPGTPPDRLPKQPFISVTEQSIPERRCEDRASQASLEFYGAERIIASFVVRVEIVPGPAGPFERTIVHRIREDLPHTIGRHAAAIEAAIKEELVRLPSPSPPGAPPGFDTGRLLKSIDIRIDDDGLGAAIGSPLDYARFLELGTEDMAERPFLFCALEGRKRRIRNDVEQQVRKTIGLATGTFGPTDELGFPRKSGNPMEDAIAFWARYIDLKNFGAPAATPPPDKTFRERVEDFVNEFREGLDEFMKDPSNSPAGPLDLPPLPPPTGRIPLPGRFPKRFR